MMCEKFMWITYTKKKGNDKPAPANANRPVASAILRTRDI